MNLQSVKAGDIIRVAGMHALVIRKEPRRLVVQGICGQNLRRVRAGEVEKHWIASRRTS